MSYLYGEQDGYNAGQAKATGNGRLSYRSIIKSPIRLRMLQIGAAASIINFLFLAWLINPHHIAPHGSIIATAITLICFLLIALVELIRMVQSLSCWFFAYNAVNPVPVVPPAGGRIALITEINTGRETSEAFIERLRAMKAVRYNGTVDVWILDEDDDPQVKKIAESMQVKHFSRQRIGQLNTDSGPFQRDTAFGNANAWRELHENNYDIVANINPDDWLSPNFLERTLGYFLDPDTAFVTIPHVYANQESWLTRAAAAQKFLFHAILQRGANKFGSPVLSSASHLYRASAWQQIGGYQPGELSDNLTGMLIHGTTNQFTGKNWRGVYTPDVLAVGQGPDVWQDYFNMESLWAYGTWRLILTHARKLDRKLKPAQSLYYAAAQYIVPGLTITWLTGNLVSVLFFIFGMNVMSVSDADWVIYWGLSLGVQVFMLQWLCRFNVSDYEQEEGGLDAILLTLVSLPIYVMAAIRAMKGSPPEIAQHKYDNPIRAFRPHLIWSAFIAGMTVFGFIKIGHFTGMMLWPLIALSVTILPAGLIWYKTKRPVESEVRELNANQS